MKLLCLLMFLGLTAAVWADTYTKGIGDVVYKNTAKTEQINLAEYRQDIAILEARLTELKSIVESAEKTANGQVIDVKPPAAVTVDRVVYVDHTTGEVVNLGGVE